MNSARENGLRVVIIVPGGFATGRGNLGVPAFHNLILRLSELADVAIVSLCEISREAKKLHSSLNIFDFKYSSNFLRQAFKIRQRLRREMGWREVDIIHGFWTFPSCTISAILGMTLKARVIANLQGGCMANLPKINYGGNQGYLKKIVNNWTLRKSDVIVAECEFQKKLLDPKFLRKVIVVEYGFEGDQLAVSDYGLHSPLKLLYVGNINAVKNPRLLLSTLALVHSEMPARLTLVGPDYSEGELKELLAEYKVEHLVDLKGYLDRAAVFALMIEHDILLVTSLHEGSPLVFVEAMAHGLPVSGTKVGLMADLDGDTCLASSIDNPEEHAHNTVAIARDESLRLKLIDRGLAWTRQYTMDSMVDKYRNLYHQEGEIEITN